MFGHNQLPKPERTIEGDYIDEEDDRYWKLGMIYFNKNDFSVLISRRVGGG